jgi:hypothetical protein
MDIVWDILRQIPEYIFSFLGTVSSPQTYPLKKADQESSKQKKLVEALTFLVLSFTITLVLASVNFGDDVTLTQLANLGLSLLIVVSLLGLAIYLAWRLVGSKREFFSYFIIYCYQIGILFVFLSLINKLSDGLLFWMDPELFAEVEAASIAEKPSDAAWMGHASFLTSSLVFVLGILISMIWFFIGWGSYRELNKETQKVSFKALVIAIGLAVPLAGIGFLLLPRN